MSKEESEFEELLAMYCAPVLKFKKIANMFHVNREQFIHLNKLIKIFKSKLQKFEIDFYLFQIDSQLITVYVYRKKALLLHLSNSTIKLFLAKYGYPLSNDLAELFKYLNYRLNSENGYPHEIGIFLGFPLNDVKGFILNYPCYHVGYWKVYSNVENAIQLFKQFDKCRDELLNGIYSGRRIENLLMA
ncbi:DUF3793 family protein [[Eubacterium] hominis]|mgnify:CR=1 FL=1|uniref:DUF3793 family protein n=1 Tax=[Eubacterium] hominis TaxID=2764325 RepID=UPI0022E77FD9